MTRRMLELIIIRPLLAWTISIHLATEETFVWVVSISSELSRNIVRLTSKPILSWTVTNRYITRGALARDITSMRGNASLYP